MIENKLGIYVHIPFCFSKCPYCDFYSVGAGKARQGRIQNRMTAGNSKAEADGYYYAGDNIGDSLKAVFSAESVDVSYKSAEMKQDGMNGAACDNSLIREYINGVKKEICDFFEKNRGKYEVETIYFGGGTPNSLHADELREMLDCILENAGLEEQDAADNAPAKGSIGITPEITIEVNPKPIKKGKNLAESKASGVYAERTDAAAWVNVSGTDFKALRRMGFNRLSIGTQSFDDGILKKLGRPHSVEDNIETVRLAKEAGFDNISLDLMFGIPGQTEEVWEDTVRRAIEMDCRHISMYSLEFMEGTRFTRMLEDGRMQETAEETDRMMYHKAIDMLVAAGYRQYEISNFAKPGFESRHNSKYWMLEEYAGFGPSAHSYIGNRRYSNPADLELYIKNPLGRIVYGENTVFDDMSEFVFTGLRMADGVDTEKFMEKFGMDIWAAFESAREEFERFAAEGYAEITDDRIRLTLKGFDISNRIMCLFV